MLLPDRYGKSLELLSSLAVVKGGTVSLTVVVLQWRGCFVSILSGRWRGGEDSLDSKVETLTPVFHAAFGNT